MIEVANKLEHAGYPYMLTGSMALNMYAMPRMTRDIDFVVAITPHTVKKLPEIFTEQEYYLSADAASDAVNRFSCFNLIHLSSMIKIDFMVRKNEEYRLTEFSRRKKMMVENGEVWITSKEDLILSKLEWAKDSKSSRQIEDVKHLLSTEYDTIYLQQWATQLQLNDMLTLASA